MDTLQSENDVLSVSLTLFHPFCVVIIAILFLYYMLILLYIYILIKVILFCTCVVVLCVYNICVKSVVYWIMDLSQSFHP